MTAAETEHAGRRVGKSRAAFAATIAAMSFGDQMILARRIQEGRWPYFAGLLTRPSAVRVVDNGVQYIARAEAKRARKRNFRLRNAWGGGVA